MHAKPLIEVMGITHQGRSEAVNRALSDFGSEASFEQAAQRFQEHYHYAMSVSAVSRMTKHIAWEAQAYVEQKFAEADTPAEPPVTTMLVELDGCDLRTAQTLPLEHTTETSPIRRHPKKTKQINWREVRIGFARPLESPDKMYIGKMAAYPEVVSQLGAAARLAGLGSTTRVVGVADGGHGLKEALEQQFEHLQFILDKTHLKDHLYETAEAVGICQHDRTGWVTGYLETISRGDVAESLQQLAQLATAAPNPRLNRLCGYLQRFSDAINYADFKARGYPIGSGEIESAHKSIPQKRLKLPGACWHPDSINPMLALRILRANRWWENFWNTRAKHIYQQS
jgi:hypothetical protein